MPFRNHRFSRLELLIGREALARYRNKHVMVVGLGGVGSYAVEALARAAVGHITLVDHDDVCATNVNRQIHALTDTVGKQKAILLAERVKKINPHANAYPIVEHHHPEKGDRIFEEAERLAGRPVDAVLECIDTLVPKVDLLMRCLQKKVQVISAMGSASKLDPSKIRVGDISETTVDPLAKQVRLRLRDNGIETGIKVVYSTEKSIQPEQAIGGTDWQCICPTTDKEFGACSQKRIMLGTISYLPPIFGMWMASELLREWIADLDLSDRAPLAYMPTYDEQQRETSL